MQCGCSFLRYTSEIHQQYADLSTQSQGKVYFSGWQKIYHNQENDASFNVLRELRTISLTRTPDPDFINNSATSLQLNRAAPCSGRPPFYKQTRLSNNRQIIYSINIVACVLTQSLKIIYVSICS